MQATDSLEQRLRDLLKGRDIASLGAIQLINLETLRERFEQPWERISARVWAIIEAVLDRHLTPGDTFNRLSDLAYVVIFGRLRSAEAEVKMLMVAAEIARRLLGDTPDAHELVRVMVLPVSGEGARPADILSTFRRLAEEEEAGTTMSRPAAVPPGSDQPDPPWQRFGEAPTGTVEWEAGAAANPVPDEPQWAPLAGETVLPAGLQFSYRPIWDVARRVLSTYSCVACHPRMGELREQDSADTAMMVELDQRLLEQVVKDLVRLRESGRRVLMACPLHVASLSTRRARERFVATYHPLPEDIRRDIIFELIGEWEGMPLSRMAALIAMIKPVSRSVMAQVPLEWTGFELLRDGGITRASVKLAGRTEKEAVLIPLLEDFAARAAKSGIKTCARGLHSSSLAVATLGAGFDLVEGPAIHGPVKTPEHVFRFNVADLFQTLLTNSR
jgi:hypothetical protein